MRGRVVFPLLVVAALAGGPAVRAGDDLVDRRFRAALALERDGKLAEARELWQALATADPPTDRTDDALLALARLAWPVDDTARLGRTPGAAAAIGAAVPYLERIVREMPASDSAPEAAWRLALALLDPDSPARDPSRAEALLTTWPVLYPDSPRLPDVLVLLARLRLAAGHPDRAARTAFRILARWPRRSRAARAWLVLARVAGTEHPGIALRRLGRAARAAAAANDEETGRRARELATLLDRFAFAPHRAGDAPWRLRAGEGGWIPLPERAADLACSPDGIAWAALPRAGEVRPLAGPGSSLRVAGARAVAFDRWGRPWVAGEAGVRRPDGELLVLPDRGEAVDLAPTGDGDAVFVVDGRNHRVLLLGTGGPPVPVEGLPPRATPSRIAADPVGGGAVVLDRRAGTVYRVGRDGAVREKIEVGSVVPAPADVAVDGWGRLALLDGRNGAVAVLGKDGRPLVTFRLPREGDHALPRPDRIALDGAGRLAVHDARRKGVRWFD